MKKLSFIVCSFLFASNIFGDVYWTNGSGDGQWGTASNWSGNNVPPAGEIAFFQDVGGTVNITSDAQIRTIRVTGSTPVTLNIAYGATLSLANRGGAGLLAIGADLTVEGDGQLAISTNEGTDSQNTNHLDNGARAGRKLIINTQIVPGQFDSSSTVQTGFESWIDTPPGGEVVLGHTANAFTMNMNAGGGHTISVSKVGAAGAPSGLGAINTIVASANTAIRYTGTGDTAGYEFRVNGGGAIVQDGAGLLTWAGTIVSANTSAQTVTLRGTTSGRVTGTISNTPGALSVTKADSGIWTLAGNNTFTGGITVNDGTLGLDSVTAAGGASQITMASGTTLHINPSHTLGFTAALPAVSAPGSVTIDIDAATSEVTFNGMSAASANIIATLPGTTIKITGLQDGLVAPWLTLNGAPATYDQNTGLSTTTVSTQSLRTRGDTLPDNADLTAVIDTLGTTGTYIDMTSDPTTLYSLKQTVTAAGGEATVNLNGGTFMATELAIASGAKDLTIGVLPQDGTFLPPLQLGSAQPAPVDSSAISNLNPIVWYDPSEKDTVTVSIDTVSLLVNKGSLKAAMNAVPRSGGSGPTYATGGVSDSTLPMLKIDTNSKALHSLGATGITGNDDRTLIAVMSRGTAGNEFPIGFGNNATGQDFTINMQPNNLNTRFNTWSGDLDVATPNIGVPFVATFFNNPDGNNPDTLSAAVASTNAGSWNANGGLRTGSSTFKIGHRHNEANSGRGQAGEILLFAKTLSAAERKIVEDYLTQKWLQPKSTVASQNALVTLRNDSTAGDLTINAAVIEPDGDAVALVKVGEGDAVLAGGTKLSGPVTIGEGTLTVATPSAAVDTLSGVISGGGHLTKDGPGMLVLPLSTVNQYSGGTDILDGTIRIGNSRSLGTGPLTITPGATLDLGSGAPDAIVINNRVTVSGEGVDNAGAIVNNSAVPQRNAFQNTTVTLADDTSFGGIAVNWDFRGGSILDLNQHILSKVGAADLRFSPGSISNAPAGKAIHIKQGHLGLESGMNLYPNTSAQEIHIDTGARFGVYQKSQPTHWTIVPADGAEISAFGNNEYLNQNVFTADMVLPAGTVKFTASGNFNKNFTGQISGQGGLIVSNGGARAMSLLSHPNNTFAGNVAVHNAILGLHHPGSLPGGLPTLTERLTFETLPAGVRAFMGGANGWTGGDVKQLAESGLFNAGTTYLQIHVDANESGSIDDDIGSPFLGMLDKFGAGALALNGDVTMGSASIRSFAGTLALTNGATVSLGTNHLYIGDATVTDGTAGINTTIIGSNSKLTSTDLGRAVQNGPQVYVAAHNSKSVLELKDTAEVTAKLAMGGDNTADTSAFGAVYQSGESKFLSTGGGSNDGRIGFNGYGYYQLGGGTLTLKGWTQLGRNATSVGILHQTGGAFAFNGKRYGILGVGIVGESYDGSLGISRGGTGILHLEGGTFEHYGELRLTDISDNNNTGGTAIMTVDGLADAMIDRQIEIGYRTNGVAILNLNGGKLTTTYINRMPAPSTSTVNFNGGILCVTNNTGNTRLIAGVDAAAPLNAYVYDGGAVIEIGAGVTRTLDVPLQQPDGPGIKAIRITNGGSGYIAPPHVAITGGDGSGATAIARIDRATGTVIGIEVTNPGRGYTSIPTVVTNTPVSSSAGGTGLTFGVIERAGSTLGGLTKTGDGILVLNVPNTYPGATRVEGGILRVGHPDAIPVGSDVIIGDGTLDLAGHTITCASVTIEGTGSIANGKVVTASAVKTGTGTGAWDAAIEFADADTAIPGLWEGMFKGSTVDDYWNTTSPNPRFAIQPTTRAANGGVQAANGTYADNLWNGGYRTWAYSGYIWNRATTNVLWTFFGRFDDRIRLTIDDVVIFNDIGNGSDVFRTVLLTPGPHAFDARFGDGTGDVGPGPKDRTVFPVGGVMSGLLVDYSGLAGSTAVLDRFQILADDGTGNLFTATLGNEADTAIRVEEGTLLLPAPEPGLWEGWLDGRASTAPNPKTSVELTTIAANGYHVGTPPDLYHINGKPWTNNSSYVYTGYIWNRAATNETWTFAENFDDDTRLTIDGTPVLTSTDWATATIGSVTLTPGSHAFEVRFGQGSGGVGCPNPGDATVAANSGWWGDFERSKSFVVDFLGRNEKIAGNYDDLIDDGDGMLLSLTPLGALPDLSGLIVDVAPDATLDMGGIPHSGLIVTGQGHITNGVFGASSILSPAGDNFTGTMAIDGLATLSGLTYHLTIHDYAAGQLDNQPGLREGVLSGDFNMMDPNTGITVEPTVTAANGGFNTGAPAIISGKPWSEHSTYVYTGYIWNRAATNETWTFAEHFDDSVLLIINNKIILNDSTWGTPTKGNATLKPGPNAFEVRFGQGTGGGGCPGPTGSLWWDDFNRDTAFAIDFAGRDSTVADNYTVLTDQFVADVGGGPLFTVTGNVNNDVRRNDVITSLHPLDLTGLTIKPSDGASISPTGNNYVIATAPSFTGVPTVVNFEGKTWKTLRKGNELLLTTQGGTIIILK